MTEIAIIGGTGFGQLPEFENGKSLTVETPYGEAYLQSGNMHGAEITFLPRHGPQANIPPHKINYRANVHALQQLGIKDVIGLAAVGSTVLGLGVGSIVIPDQIVDYTMSRSNTFFDDEIHHIDFTYPYHETLRQDLIQAFAQLPDMELHTTGTYAATEGPRLETAAEVRRLANDGCTIVGMTGMPEAALVREKQMNYACVAMVVNAGAGLNDQIIELEAIHAVMKQASREIVLGLAHYLAS